MVLIVINIGRRKVFVSRGKIVCFYYYFFIFLLGGGGGNGGGGGGGELNFL